MIILAIDPSKFENKRGFACYESERAVFLPRERWRGITHVIVEGQWANPKASRQSLMALSFYAGWLLGSASAAPSLPGFVLPVATWKGALFGSAFANAPKDVFSANIRQLLTRSAHPLPKSDHDLDAMGIALAAAKMGASALARYEVR